MTPKTIVIMLTHNCERLLKRITKCVIAQDFCDFEFIIVDNGSSDNSGIIAKKYSTANDKIKISQKEQSNIYIAKVLKLYNLQLTIR